MSSISPLSTHRASAASCCSSDSDRQHSCDFDLSRQFTVPTPNVDAGLFFRLVYQTARKRPICNTDIQHVAKQTLMDATDEEITESIRSLFKHAINPNELIATAEMMLEGNLQGRISGLMRAVLAAI